ncbi:MAG: hypothetical protein ACJASX_004076 [Limisphaerales bacterium]
MIKKGHSQLPFAAILRITVTPLVGRRRKQLPIGVDKTAEAA